MLLKFAEALDVDVSVLTLPAVDAELAEDGGGAGLRLDVRAMRASVESRDCLHECKVLVLTDGVMKVELFGGPAEAARQARNGMVRVNDAVGAYLKDQALAAGDQEGRARTIHDKIVTYFGSGYEVDEVTETLIDHFEAWHSALPDRSCCVDLLTAMHEIDHAALTFDGRHQHAPSN
jgi:hypothetical protein